MDGLNIPAWAGAQFNDKSTYDELVALREFFESWKALHAITDGRMKKQKMEAADIMVQKSIVVKKIQNA